MDKIITITHSNEGIRVSRGGTTRLFSNAAYLAEAYAHIVAANCQAKETALFSAAKCLESIVTNATKAVDVLGSVDGDFWLEKLNELDQHLKHIEAMLSDY